MKHGHPPKEKAALIVRLRKIRGQLLAIEKMVEEDADCPEVLMQVVSARRAIKSFGDEIIHSTCTSALSTQSPRLNPARNCASSWACWSGTSIKRGLDIHTNGK